uniref:Uncharacterized protein n=1 Tax=Micrurus corallinus TaxID=54390 RepID=A0A2D4F776_MICCO
MQPYPRPTIEVFLSKEGGGTTVTSGLSQSVSPHLDISTFTASFVQPRVRLGIISILILIPKPNDDFIQRFHIKQEKQKYQTLRHPRSKGSWAPEVVFSRFAPVLATQ